jgi:hypothetical protein
MILEPSSIQWSDVIEFLERVRRPGMAEFCRLMSQEEKRFANARHNWERREAGLLERLQKYEPPTQWQQPPTFTPPSEASD